MTENALAKEIVDAAFRIHTTSDPDYWNRFTMPCSLMNLLSVDSERSANRQSRWSTGRSGWTSASGRT